MNGKFTQHCHLCDRQCRLLGLYLHVAVFYNVSGNETSVYNIIRDMSWRQHGDERDDQACHCNLSSTATLHSRENVIAIVYDFSL